MYLTNGSAESFAQDPIVETVGQREEFAHARRRRFPLS